MGVALAKWQEATGKTSRHITTIVHVPCEPGMGENISTLSTHERKQT